MWIWHGWPAEIRGARFSTSFFCLLNISDRRWRPTVSSFCLHLSSAFLLAFRVDFRSLCSLTVLFCFASAPLLLSCSLFLLPISTWLLYVDCGRSLPSSLPPLCLPNLLASGSAGSTILALIQIPTPSHAISSPLSFILHGSLPGPSCHPPRLELQLDRSDIHRARSIIILHLQASMIRFFS